MEDLAALFNAFYTRFVLRDLLAKITPGTIVLVAISTIFIWKPEDVAHYFAGLTIWAWTILLAFSWITGIAIQSIGECFGNKTNGRFGIRYYPKEKFLFSIDAKFEKDLNNCVITEELKKEFTYNGETLSDNATVKKEERPTRWKITDGEKFIIKKEDDPLNVYGKFNTDKEWYKFHVKFSNSRKATPEDKQNVERFIVIKEACGNGSFAFLIVIVLLIAKRFIPCFKKSLQLEGCDKPEVLCFALIIAIIFTLFLQWMHKIHVQRQYDYMLAVLEKKDC